MLTGRLCGMLPALSDQAFDYASANRSTPTQAVKAIVAGHHTLSATIRRHSHSRCADVILAYMVGQGRVDDTNGKLYWKL